MDMYPSLTLPAIMHGRRRNTLWCRKGSPHSRQEDESATPKISVRTLELLLLSRDLGFCLNYTRLHDNFPFHFNQDKTVIVLCFFVVVVVFSRSNTCLCTSLYFFFFWCCCWLLLLLFWRVVMVGFFCFLFFRVPIHVFKCSVP